MTAGAGNQEYLSYDGRGSVTDLTDGTGTVTDTYDYDVFGAVRTRTGTTASAWKFTGEQADDGTGDSGYYYLRARHLDVATGRFIGRDKVEFAQRYAYAKNNPVLLTDPSGECIACYWMDRLMKAHNEVFGLCIVGSVGLGAGAVGSACLAVNANSVGVTITGGGGGETSPSAGVAASGLYATNAPTVDDLRGPAAYGGGEVLVAPGVGAGLSVAASRGTNDQVVTQYYPSVGLVFGPLPVNARGGGTNTLTWSWRPSWEPVK